MLERPRSPLPTEPEYWDGLARRVRDDAVGPLAAYASIEAESGEDRWYALLAGQAPWLVAVSAAAMLVLWLSMPTADSAGERWLQRSVAPTEVAGTLIAGPEPPRVDVLLAQFPPPLDEEDGRQ